MPSVAMIMPDAVAHGACCIRATRLSCPPWMSCWTDHLVKLLSALNQPHDLAALIGCWSVRRGQVHVALSTWCSCRQGLTLEFHVLRPVFPEKSNDTIMVPSQTCLRRWQMHQ